MPAQLRAARYVRVSSDDQTKGYSPETQTGNVDRYCAAHGWATPDEWLIVTAESAWRVGRGDFARLMKIARAPNGPDVIVFDRVDRSARNMADYVRLEALADELGIEIHAASDGLVLGRRGAIGAKTMWGMRALMARDFSDLLSARTRDARRTKMSAGGWSHAAPLGYRNVRDGRRGRLELDAERAAIIRDVARELLRDALTVAQAAERARLLGLRSRTGRPLTAGMLGHLLRHPVLAGLIPLHGDAAEGIDGEPWRLRQGKRGGRDVVLVPGQHEAVLDELTWRRVQTALDARRGGRGPRRIRHSPAYQGLMRCGGCDARVTAEVHQRGARVHVYYRCAASCGSGRISTDRLTSEIAAVLERVTIPREVVTQIQAQLRAATAAARNDAAKAAKTASANLRRARTKLDAAQERLLDGTLEPDEYRTLRSRLTAEVAEAEALQRDSRATGDGAVDDLCRVLETLASERALFEGASPAGRGEIAAALLESPRLVGGRLIAAPWRAAEALAEASRLNASQVTEGATVKGRRRASIPLGSTGGCLLELALALREDAPRFRALAA